MNKYEVMFIVNPELGEDGIKAVSDKFKSMLESAGTVETFAEWGKRRLAYPIQDLTENVSAPVFHSATRQLLYLILGYHILIYYDTTFV